MQENHLLGWLNYYFLINYSWLTKCLKNLQPHRSIVDYRVMATANVSSDKTKDSFLLEQLYCSLDLTAGIHGQLTFISVLNSFLSITAFLGNALMLVALRKESSLHPPSKHLLRTLTTTDLCVGLIAEPLFVTLLLVVVNEDRNICHYAAVAVSNLTYILCGVSLFTLTAISVERLLALLLGLRYKQIVTLKRTYVITVIFCVVSTALSTFWNFLNFIVGSLHITIIVSLCLIICVFSYTTIFLTLRHHQNQVQGHVQQPNQTNQLNIARYKKAVSTVLWLQFMLVVCYLPFVIFVTLVIHTGPSSSVSLACIYSSTFVFLNSSLNPILYCWKIDEVRQAVKEIIRQVLCY